VEPQSDRPALRPTTTGFTLSADAPDGLAVSPTDASTAAQADAIALTRSFDFTADTVPALLRRMQSQVESAATAQPLARRAPREQAAQSMISLGMGAEAEALLQLAVSEDPRAATDPTQIGLSAIAALLAGRMADAASIDDNRLPATDEVALWRAVHDATRQEGSPKAAAVFAAETPLIMAYPEALQARLLPLAAETMALGGQVADASRLLAKRPGDPTLALARGMVAQAEGNTKAALAAYDGVAASPDQLASARAALRAAQLRLSSGEIGPDKAADAEEKLLYAWRGDGWEVALRRQIADLRAQAGQWRQALSMLRESQPLFPDDAPAMHDQMLDILARLLRDDGPSRMAPLDLVALVEENADLLPDGPAGETMAATFADRLVGLDLPQRAEPVLEKLMQSATGAAKGIFGLQLATLHLNQADATGALAVLANSASDSQSAAVAEQRALLQARALAATGETAKAVDMLHAVGTPAADEARAAVLEAAHDWPGATAALVDYVARVVPPNGPLEEPQAHILLRLASAAAQAGNETVLAQLRRDAGPRIAAMPNEQKLAETFRFLTERPIGSATDLPRAAAETQTIPALPAAISQLNHTASK
jgi:tetratricopeptide (TPR) repeat protein